MSSHISRFPFDSFELDFADPQPILKRSTILLSLPLLLDHHNAIRIDLRLSECLKFV